MVAGSSPKPLRTLGPVYTLPPNTPPSNNAILAALANVMTAHPMLRVGIINEVTTEAQFVHIPEINLNELVEFRTVPRGEDYNKTIDDVQAWCHDQMYKNIESRPPWRIIVLRPASNPTFEDVIFSFHHSIMDGVGSRKFHEYFLTELNSLAPEKYTSEFHPILSFPEPPSLPEAQEAVLGYTRSLSFWAATIRDEAGPSFLKPAKPVIWAAGPVNLAHPHRTRVHSVDIPAPIVASLLTATRSHSTSITALFHALVLASLVSRIPEAPAFASSTPIEMRPYLSSTADPALRDSIRLLISSMLHQFSPSDISAFRAPDADLDALIWHHARSVKIQISKRTAILPADDKCSMLSYVTDWQSYWNKREGKLSDKSWEVSNIGRLRIPSAGDGERSISRALFTNGPMVSGGPMSISAASVPDGVLTLGISWNKDIVQEELMSGLANDLEAFMKRFHETGKFVA
ncbi:alcohol acetyltransferase [Fusarium albosuccineum]|uniref:Alcohol acetyltransferase n=1 Tax=Fusarium albosuccineum TaxID=1237068 RepID=A0A8H4KX61_9HYPO|nr:alcohol acetyltransferase [Fusarium albosuccineum]